MNEQIKMIQLQTTSLCSGKCLVCPFKRSWHYNNPGYMNDESFLHVLDELQSFLGKDYPNKICLYLMNDPFMDKKMVERTETVFQYFPNCHVELSTNGIPLNPDISEKIIDVITKYDKKNRSMIWLSIFGKDKKTWEFLTGREGKYEQAIQNIISYLKVNAGRVKTFINSASGSSRDNSMHFYAQEQWFKYINGLFAGYKLPTENVEVRYFLFHNRAGKVRIGNWNGKEFYREIDEYHPFDCWRYRQGIHILYNGDIVPCCFTGDTLVLAEKELKPIKSIKIGEKVYGHDRQLHEVTEVFERDHKGDLLSIRTWNYYEPIECTPEHPILARKYLGRDKQGTNEYGESNFISADKLEKKDLIYVPRIKIKDTITDIPIRKYALPNDNLVVLDKKIYAVDKMRRTILKDHFAPLIVKTDQDLMWVFGFYLAEGWIKRSDRTVTFSMHRKEKEYADRILKILEEHGFGIHKHSLKYYRTNNLDLNITNRVLSKLLQNLFGTGCNKKKIHKDLFNHSNRRLLSLVQGFGDGDGEIREDRDRLVTTSEILAKQLYLILLRNNIIPGISEQHKENRLTSYTINITKNNNSRHVRRDNKIGFWYPVREINTEEFSGTVYNIEVRDIHSYLINGIFSVHNCMCYDKDEVWGNLKEQSLQEIWDGDKRQDFINKATGIKESDDNFICRKCMSVGG